MIIERATTIARPIGDVFDFVIDACNDPIWCRKVKSVDPCAGDGQQPGTRYIVMHRPIPFLPARRMEHTLVAAEPPHRIEWLEDDGHDRFAVTYLLERTGTDTRFTQRSDAQLATPRILDAVMRAGIGRDIAAQLEHLRRHLERA